LTSPSQASQALDQYGPLAQIVQAVPDLAGLLNTAIQQQWTPAHLQASIMATPWYQSHSDTARSLLMTQASDPAAYNQQLENARQQVQSAAGAMGRSVDANSLAVQYLMNGWSSQELQNQIGYWGGIANENGSASAPGALAGDAGRLQTHMDQVASSYGVPYSQDYLQSWVQRIQSGNDTIDGFDSAMRIRAKMQYPQYATQLDQGMTMAQIADPYMAQMAKTLEVPQSSINLSTPEVQKALSVRDPQSGAATSQSMWAFTQQLKADPRYDKTTQAKTDAYTTLAQIGKDFGFGGGTTGATTAGAAQ
jgi:hypothetical protein